MTTSFNELLERWQRLPAWASSLSCVSGSERCYPVIRELASRQSADFCRKALDAAWLSLLPAKQDSSLDLYLGEIGELPESSTDDSNLPEFHAMRAISVLAYALDAVAGERPPAQCHKYSVSALLQLSADLGGAAQEAIETQDHESVRKKLEGVDELNENVVSELKKLSIEMASSYTDAAKSYKAR